MRRAVRRPATLSILIALSAGALIAIVTVMGGVWSAHQYRQRRHRESLSAAVNVLANEGSLVHVRDMDRPTEVFLRSNLTEAGARALCGARYAVILFLEQPPGPKVREVLLTQYRSISPYSKEASTVAFPRAVAFERHDTRASWDD